MSFPVAFQSAVFYFIACTPCAKARHRQKARDKAKKEREEKAKLESEQPNLYRHPSPFNTNPYWQDEINKGPSLPKKSASKNSSQRALNSSGHDSSPPSVSEPIHVEDSRTHVGDSTTTMPEDEKWSDDWNRRHGYQREDEELWGQWSGHRLMDAFSKARDSAGRLIESTLGIEKEVTEQERRDFYFSPRNPPVNDYHPPVVSSKDPTKHTHKWMLQPPPPAKIMEGKVPVGRAISSASKSSSKTLLVGEDVYRGRMLPEKLLKEKRRKEANPTEDELINSLFYTRSNRSSSFRRNRSLSLDGISAEGSDESLSTPLEIMRSRPKPVAIPPGIESEDDSGDDSVPSPSSRMGNTLHPTMSGHAAQRPKLETIRSAGSNGSNPAVRNPRMPRAGQNRSRSGTTSPRGD